MKRAQFLFGLLGLGITGYSSSIAPKITFFGRKYYNISRMCSNLGLTFGSSGKNMFLKARGLTINLIEESRLANINRVDVSLSFAPFKKNGAAYISVIDFDTILSPLFFQYYAPKKPIRIMLDPGHGGKDPGCQSADKKISESHIVLKVAKQLASNLSIWGFNVKLTRTTDKHLTLSERTELARKWKADLFISLHTNSVTSNTAKIHGVETHIFPPLNAPPTNSATPITKTSSNQAFSKQNSVLGFAMQTSILKSTKANDRWLRYSNFAVLRSAPCPAVLLELGFMSNAAELKKLNSYAYQQLLIAGIIAGVRTYQLKAKGNNVFR